MRNLVDVLTEIIAVVPTSEESLLAKLKATQTSAKYTAPEMAGQRWNQAAVILESEIGEPKEEWQKKVARIFAGPDISISELLIEVETQ